MSAVRTREHGDDADQRVPVLLFLPVVLGTAQTATGRLLRLLLLLQSGVPTQARGSRVLTANVGISVFTRSSWPARAH